MDSLDATLAGDADARSLHDVRELEDSDDLLKTSEEETHVTTLYRLLQWWHISKIRPILAIGDVAG